MFEPFHPDGETPYDTKKFTMGWDPKFKDADTNLLAEYVKDLLIEGYKSHYLAKRLVDELGFKGGYADAFICKCYKRMQANINLDPDVIKSENVRKLYHIYEQAVQTGNYKAATSAIAEINKLCGLNKQTVEITTNEYQLNFDTGEE